MTNAAPLLLFLPTVLFALKADFPKKENITSNDPFPVEVPTLEDFFYSFYQDDFEFDGEKANIHDALITLRSNVKIMEKNLKIAKGHLRKMELMNELALVVFEYETNLKDKEFPEDLYQYKMRNILFLVAVTQTAEMMEKLGIFFMIVESYPAFEKLAKKAIDVASEYRHMRKHLATVSTKVEMAYAIVLKITMCADDPEALEELEEKLDRLLETFSDKDHDDLRVITIKMLETKENLKYAVSLDILEELRETLKY